MAPRHGALLLASRQVWCREKHWWHWDSGGGGGATQSLNIGKNRWGLLSL